MCVAIFCGRNIVRVAAGNKFEQVGEFPIKFFNHKTWTIFPIDYKLDIFRKL